MFNADEKLRGTKIRITSIKSDYRIQGKFSIVICHQKTKTKNEGGTIEEKVIKKQPERLVISINDWRRC